MKKILTSIVITLTILLCSCGNSVNKIETISDLEGRTIGVQKGTTGDTLAGDINNAAIKKFDKCSAAINALENKEIDAVIIDYDTALVFTENSTNLKIMDEAFSDEEYAIALKLDNSQLQEEINSALEQLANDGTLSQIKANYEGSSAGDKKYESPQNVDRSNGTLIMATNAEFPPYEYMENDEIVGIDIDMMRAVCDKLGYELSIKNMTFDSIFTAVQSGEADVGVAGITATEDRKANMLFSDTYAVSHQVVIINDD